MEATGIERGVLESDGRRHVPRIEREIIAGTSEAGSYDFVLWESPCPGCNRMLWGWIKGLAIPTAPVPFTCPCGATGMTDQFLNVERRSVEARR